EKAPPGRFGGARRTALLVIAARPLVGGVRGLAARRAEGGGLGRDGLEGVAGDRGDKSLLDESLEDRRDRHGVLVAADDLPDGPGGHRTNLPRGPNLGTKCHVLHVGLLGASVPGLSGRLIVSLHAQGAGVKGVGELLYRVRPSLTLGSPLDHLGHVRTHRGRINGGLERPNLAARDRTHRGYSALVPTVTGHGHVPEIVYVDAARFCKLSQWPIVAGRVAARARRHQRTNTVQAVPVGQGCQMFYRVCRIRAVDTPTIVPRLDPFHRWPGHTATVCEAFAGAAAAEAGGHDRPAPAGAAIGGLLRGAARALLGTVGGEVFAVLGAVFTRAVCALRLQPGRTGRVPVIRRGRQPSPAASARLSAAMVAHVVQATEVGVTLRAVVVSDYAEVFELAWW